MKLFNAFKLTVLIFSVVLTCIGCALQKPIEKIKEGGRSEMIAAETPDKTPAELSGAEIYKTNCAECHGANGEGSDKGISFLKGHALHHPEKDFIRQVTNGEKDEMPAFKEKLTDSEIERVVRYVREEIQSKAEKEKTAGHSH